MPPSQSSHLSSIRLNVPALILSCSKYQRVPKLSPMISSSNPSLFKSTSAGVQCAPGSMEISSSLTKIKLLLFIASCSYHFKPLFQPTTRSIKPSLSILVNVGEASLKTSISQNFRSIIANSSPIICSRCQI